MMRQLLIDGYNLMYAMEARGRLPHFHEGDLQSRREFLIELMSDYASSKSVDIQIVFDSKESLSKLPDRDRVGRVHIEYCHKEESADDFIVQKISQKPSSYIAISNDRFILREAERFGALTIKVDEFIEKIKSVQLTDPPIDAPWFDDKDDEDRELYPKVHTQKKGASRKLSKKERKKKKALKKI